MKDNRCIARITSLEEAVTIELLDHVEIKCRPKRLIEQLNRNDHVLVLLLCILASDRLQNVQSLSDRVPLAPLRTVPTLTTVIETILGLWCTMKILSTISGLISRRFAITYNPDLETQSSRPVYRGIDIYSSTLRVWLPCSKRIRPTMSKTSAN